MPSIRDRIIEVCESGVSHVERGVRTALQPATRTFLASPKSSYVTGAV
jgi:hypothetical protein